MALLLTEPGPGAAGPTRPFLAPHPPLPPPRPRRHGRSSSSASSAAAGRGLGLRGHAVPTAPARPTPVLAARPTTAVAEAPAVPAPAPPPPSPSLTRSGRPAGPPGLRTRRLRWRGQRTAAATAAVHRCRRRCRWGRGTWRQTSTRQRGSGGNWTRCGIGEVLVVEAAWRVGVWGIWGTFGS